MLNKLSKARRHKTQNLLIYWSLFHAVQVSVRLNPVNLVSPRSGALSNPSPARQVGANVGGGFSDAALFDRTDELGTQDILDPSTLKLNPGTGL